ncbi:hypothetical protein OS493_032794 [Desmophyllum pertusum]|uniref:Uncharacterized protein n=1 Tax=Desmophyllum pertusum TaxID=174260 RepID=A0A9X0CX67_9CNID|nr:hypothetical protein OS493_032794 [Desmophyllum pertusum]
MELVLLCVSIAAAIISLILLTIIRVQESERLFVHKNLLLSIGLGNLVYVLDKTLFSSRNEHHVICLCGYDHPAVL